MPKQVHPILIALLVVAAFALLPATAMTALAANPLQEPQPGGSAQVLVDMVASLARLFIQFFVFSSVSVFAVSVARGLWSAQLANLVGSPMGVSQAWLNIIAAVFIFALSVMATTFVGVVFDAIRGYVDTSFTLPQF